MDLFHPPEGITLNFPSAGGSLQMRLFTDDGFCPFRTDLLPFFCARSTSHHVLAFDAGHVFFRFPVPPGLQAPCLLNVTFPLTHVALFFPATEARLDCPAFPPPRKTVFFFFCPGEKYPHAARFFLSEDTGFYLPWFAFLRCSLGTLVPHADPAFR